MVVQGKRNHGLGTVLMICALELAKEWQLEKMKGVYHPRGDILKTKQWYLDIGAYFEGGWVKGDVSVMYDRCQSIKNRYGIEYTLLSPLES